MADRAKLPNGIRFEVFKRDKFTCQYCGGKAPDVVLNVDHIKPVVDGGTDDLMNLVAACFTCNNGKSDRHLDDASAVVVARDQAELIEERRQQVRMMADWQVELSQMSPETDAICEAFLRITGRALTDTGKREMRSLLRRFDMEDVIASIAVAYDTYSAERAFGYIGGICFNRVRRRDDPIGAEVARIFQALDNVRGYQSPDYFRARDLLREVIQRGYAKPEDVRRHLSAHREAFSRFRDLCDLFDEIIARGGR